eukprot:6020962-Amphidinium_carterae.1
MNASNAVPGSLCFTSLPSASLSASHSCGSKEDVNFMAAGCFRRAPESIRAGPRLPAARRLKLGKPAAKHRLPSPLPFHGGQDSYPVAPITNLKQSSWFCWNQCEGMWPVMSGSLFFPSQSWNFQEVQNL